MKKKLRLVRFILLIVKFALSLTYDLQLTWYVHKHHIFNEYPKIPPQPILPMNIYGAGRTQGGYVRNIYFASIWRVKWAFQKTHGHFHVP